MRRFDSILAAALAAFWLALAAGAAAADEAVERLFWDKKPLSVTLPVGRERLVTFPGPVRVGLPQELAGKLRTQSHHGTVYWLAKAPFENRRVEVHAVSGGGIWLLDLSARKDPALPDTPIEVLDRTNGTGAGSGPAGGPKPSGRRRPALGLVGLTRYAAQQLYAPKRLLKPWPGIHRVTLGRQPLRYLLRGQAVEATPLAGWQGGRLYVTAVALRNTERDALDLDPRRLRGDWLAATFQHTRLYPAGSEADTTAVYLISNRPFHEAAREVD